MSRFARQLLCGALAVGACASTAGAQLLGGLGLPQVGLPAPVATLPVAGPLAQDLLNTPQIQQQVIRPTLDRVAGLPASVAESGASTLLELRRLRLQALVKENRGALEQGDNGQPVRRGVVLVLDPDPASLQAAARSGFGGLASDFDPNLGIRSVQLTVPRGMSVRQALKSLRRVAPQLQADYDPI